MPAVDVHVDLPAYFFVGPRRLRASLPAPSQGQPNCRTLIFWLLIFITWWVNGVALAAAKQGVAGTVHHTLLGGLLLDLGREHTPGPSEPPVSDSDSEAFAPCVLASVR